MDLFRFPDAVNLVSAQTFKGEGHSRNGVFFEIANKKITQS